MRPVLLLALALLAAPAVHAEVSARAEGPDAPVAPEEPVPLVLEVAVDCLTLWSREVVTVGFGAEAPGNVTVTGPESAAYHRTDCPTPDGEAVKRHDFEAVVGVGARAGEALPVRLSATLPGDAVEREAFAVAQVDLVPDYVPLVQVKVSQQIKHSSNGAATYRVEVGNFGNDDVEVALRVVEGPGHGGTVDLPDPVRVPVGGSAGLDVTLRIDHDSWDQATARIAVDTVRADAGDGAETLFTNVLLRNGSLAANVREIPATPLAPLALLGLALVLRRGGRLP